MGKADKEKDGKPTVLKYLTAQNRPYSVNDITANLRNEIPKAMVQKILDALTEEGKIKEKANGKQKAYVVNQDDFPAASEVELQKIEAEISSIQNELNEVLAQVRTKEEKIKAFNSQMTTEEARAKLDEVNSEVEKLEAKLESLSGNVVNMIDQDTMNKAKNEQANAVKVQFFYCNCRRGMLRTHFLGVAQKKEDV